MQEHLCQPHPAWSPKTVCKLVGSLTSKPQASVCQGQIYLDNWTRCNTETEAEDSNFLSHSPYADTGPTSFSTDTKTLGIWPGND